MGRDRKRAVSSTTHKNSMATLIKEKVTEFTEKVRDLKTLEVGSDEHLDEINTTRSPLVKLTIMLANLNKNLSGLYNTEISISGDDMKLLTKMVSLNNQIYALLKKSKQYPYIKKTLSEFNEERGLAKEIVHDFKEFRMDSDGFKKLKTKLKSL